MNKEKLRERCYEMGNSQLPLDVFFNDIRDNKAPNFNKEEAYADLEKIVDYIEKLEKENKELKNTLLSLELDTCIPELRKENTKLRKVIKFLKDKLDINPEIYYNGYIINTPDYFIFITQEEYELLKEMLEYE